MSVYEKLLNVQVRLKAPKNQYNSFGKYHYRSCEDILEAVKPILKEEGLLLTINDTPVLVGMRNYINATATVMDIESGESVSANAIARESETKKGMDDGQITGSTSSYARKYALNGLFCIDDNKDMDTKENAEETQVKAKKQQSAVKTELTQKQIDRLYAIAGANSYDDRLIHKAIEKHYGKKHVKELTVKEYEHLCNNIEKNPIKTGTQQSMVNNYGQGNYSAGGYA